MRTQVTRLYDVHGLVADDVGRDLQLLALLMLPVVPRHPILPSLLAANMVKSCRAIYKLLIRKVKFAIACEDRAATQAFGNHLERQNGCCLWSELGKDGYF